MIKKLFAFSMLVALLALLTGCPYGYRYDQGQFPKDPVNFSGLNSMYDDFNMTSPVIEGNRYLYFSSNRNSFGQDFDIVGNNVHIEWSRDKGTLQADTRVHPWMDYHYTDSLFSRMNTPANELGPYALNYHDYSGYDTYYTDVVIFAGDADGDLDIQFVAFKGKGETPEPSTGEYLGPHPVSFLNSESDDAYLAFFGPGFVMYDYGIDPSLITIAFFCSDRDGDFDIYSVDVPHGLNILDFLRTEDSFPVSRVEVLNSSGQDKCPYIDGNLLVFASDRPGGYGGFDLYYARWTGAGWTEPVNFGDRINSEHNEYRPIVRLYSEFSNDMLLFSSDRPGGSGGYDLYYVGIPQMIN